MPIFESVTNIHSDEEKIRRRTYGMIEVVDGQMTAIHFRPWPKLISGVEAIWIGGWMHRRDQRNRCVLYFNQPVAHSNYLVLAYIQSTLGTTFASFRKSLMVLDHIAMIKKSDALLCEATNERIPDRLFRRWGWEPHLEHSKKRHWIKRFYGDFEEVKRQSQRVAEFSR